MAGAADSGRDEGDESPTGEAALPGGLDRERDLDLEGRGWHPTIRHGILTLLTLVCLAALAGAFGQRSERSTAAGAEASVTLDAPDRLRSGLIFAARLDLEAGPTGIAEPRIEFSAGWLDHITNNTIRPEPVRQYSAAGRLGLTYPRLEPAESLTVWTQWQVNPTAAGRLDSDLWVYDGSRLLTSLDRTVVIFP